MTTVLVVDQDRTMLEALRGFLEAEGHEVVTASTGWRAVELTAETRPSLVVLDLRLPDIDGVEVIRRLRTFHPHPVLILSGTDSEPLKVAALDAGGDDFLHKPFGVPELHARIRALLRRPHALPDLAALRYGDLVIDVAAHEVRLAGEPCAITPTEWRLLEALLSNPGALISHRQLFHQVWDQGYGDESRQALRTHVRSLRRKIGDDANNPSYLRTETGAGYRWIAEEGGSPGAPPEPEDDPPPHAGRRPLTKVVHDLNNVLTAMRIVVYLADPSRRSGTSDTATAPIGHDQCARLERLVTRAAQLSDELAHRRLGVGAPPSTASTVQRTEQP